MELRQLAHFLAVLDTSSFTAAALRCGLSQQALSKSIARLEEDLGGKLFKRTTRGIGPTRLGEMIAEHARQITSTATQLRNSANAELGLQRGKLTVGLSPIAAAGIIGARVMKFAEKHPTLRLDVVSGLGTNFAIDLNAGHIDVAFSAYIGQQADTVLLSPLLDENWAVVGCAENKGLSAATSLRDLKDARWLIGRNIELMEDKIAASFADAGIAVPHPGVMTDSALFSARGLRGSEYLSILPVSMAENLHGLQWRDLSGGAWKTPIYLMRRKRAHQDQWVQALLAAVGR